MVEGVVVGSDQTQEWLLPWWWDHYTHHNRYPVTFADFGLSLEKKMWCRERGTLVTLREIDFALERDAIDPELVAVWEAQFGKAFWPSRGAWFKKPLACLSSPFERSLWLDLDCEVRGNLAPLFELAEHPSGIAMARDSFEVPGIYNSGVIAFRRDLPLLHDWARASFEQNHTFRGDQELLSYLIAEQKLTIGEISPLYNWSRCQGDKPDAVIYHWHGEHGRAVIKHELWTKNL